MGKVSVAVLMATLLFAGSALAQITVPLRASERQGAAVSETVQLYNKSYALVIGNDAYAEWLSRKTGHRYRLPSEAEWEYAARGGSKTNFWWGDTPKPDNANYGKGAAGWFADGAVSGKDQWQFTAPVGSFPPNPFGLNDMNGNVWEFVQDCYHDHYNNAPNDGSARLKPPKSELDDEDDPPTECTMYVLRGGSWGYNPNFSMSASRIGINWAADSFLHYGIRLVREMD